jgi:hypothetical protein
MTQRTKKTPANMASKVCEMHKILLGNGDVDKGLVVRFAVVERETRIIMWLLGVIAATTVVELIGTWI